MRDKNTASVEVVCGDALALLADMESESVDLVIADPPYNLGKDYGNNTSKRESERYLDFSRSWIRECVRILRDSGTMYVFMGLRNVSFVYAILEREFGLLFNSWIIWHYTQGIGRKKGFSGRHDDILMFNKTNKYTFNLDAVRVPQKYYRARNNMRGANPGDVWEYSHVHYCNQNRREHPTQKPEGLVERLVRASSDPGQTVLDPFSGSGTTLRVCQQLDRRCIGIELNPEYVDQTRERLREPFRGFDSIDPRSERIPRDIRDPELRREYLKDHMEWFLSHREDADAIVERAELDLYGARAERSQDSD